jgi:hypothetical protein
MMEWKSYCSVFHLNPEVLTKCLWKTYKHGIDRTALVSYSLLPAESLKLDGIV